MKIFQITINSFVKEYIVKALTFAKIKKKLLILQQDIHFIIFFNKRIQNHEKRNKKDNILSYR